MLFNSYYFLIYFLPIVLILYYGAHRIGLHKCALAVLSVGSFVFYAYDNVYYLALLAGSILINWCVSYIINKSNKEPLRRFLMVIGIITDIGVIFYFKYYDFFISNMNALFKADFNLRHIVLPLGISFFTFQQISYLADTYKGETAEYTFIEYVAFVSFFPQLVAGPIVLHSELIPQYRDESRWKMSADRVASGLYVLAIGMFKKVIIADKFGQVVTWGWLDTSSRTGIDMLLVSLFYTFQLYFDFSGYCDMAIGIAKLFSLDLPVNFNSPYKAVSINDFWKRWHMTLTRFLTNYIYIPMGGNRKGKIRTYINILIVFLVSGIWHGANWTFILWGVIHGVLQVINRMCKKTWDRVPKAVAWFVTFMIVNFLWIMFYAPSVTEGLFVWRRIFDFSDMHISNEIFSLFIMNEVNTVLGMLGPLGALSAAHYQWYMIAYLILSFVICLCCKNLHEEKFVPTKGKAVVSALLLIWAVISFSGVSTFLYFNF
ncbi:MAG: MBOAT family protein [Lachnospiraceae bacterium]|nr:MBOAT family protein [Lachnospiraceae bacterium]